MNFLKLNFNHIIRILCLKKDKEEIDKLNQPDEEGWITVTPKNRKANLALTQRNIEKLKLKQKKKRQQMVYKQFIFKIWYP